VRLVPGDDQGELLSPGAYQALLDEIDS
jgi:hypothetical protein